MVRPQKISRFSGTITRQAFWRLALSLGLFVLLLGFTSAQLYRVAIDKAAENRANDLVSHYQARLAQLNREWELQARDFRVRIEYTRFLESEGNATLNMQAFMTVLGADRRFQYLLIQDRQGHHIFSHGKSLNLHQSQMPPGASQGHYYDPRNNSLYVVFEEPVWLGETRGMGRAAFFFQVDNALLYNLASPEVTLTVLHDSKPVASSKGQAGMDGFRSSVPEETERRQFNWTSENINQKFGFALALDAPLKTLFSTTELAVGISLIPIVDGLILLFTLGFWLMLQARRITALGRAVEEFSGKGKVTGTFIEHTDAARDKFNDEISGVSQAILEMAKTSEQREVEHRLWAKVYANSTEAIVITDCNNRIILVNNAFTQLTGYEADEIVGHNPSILSTGNLTPDFYARMWRDINEKGFWGGEIKDRRKDGSTYPKWLSIIAIRDESGEVSNYAGIFYDLSERKAREVAESSSLAKSQFLSSMSHELRTPMNAILGYAQLMRMDRNIPPLQQENLDEILNAGQHLLELINDVLDLSRIESGRLELSIEPVSVKELVKGCFSLLASPAKTKSIDLAMDFNGVPQDIQVMADPVRLKQTLINLLSNAIKYNHTQGKVRLALGKPDERTLRFSVTDNGPGISAEKQAQLFQPFHRLGMEQSSIEGTGIGLVISKRLVEAMDGQIGLESTPGIGSTFWVELKISPNSSALPEHPSDEPDNASAALFPAVLYIENNSFNLRLATQLFAHRPYLRLVTAETLKEGLPLAAQIRPKLILLNLDQPDLEIYGILDNLRNVVGDIPVVAISDEQTPQNRERIMAAGFEDCLTTPLSIEKFFAVLDNLLPNSRVDSLHACNSTIQRTPENH